MSKLSSYKRIRTSDFSQDEQPLVEKLADPINSAFDQLFYCLNGRVDFSNLFATVRDVDVVVDANGRPTSQTTFRLDRAGVITGTQVILAVNQTNSNTYPTGAPFVSFTQLDTSVLINHVAGLQPNQRYTLRIVAYNQKQLTTIQVKGTHKWLFRKAPDSLT